ncbi:lipocalin-15-like [Indicator indicator]|uniref:lipocalin-15-like n=1 Tax=Indicator indicator TaxID=1002788 RepID=UPI0023E030C2|nr:lipocalin-15-like [Indicator indicator]
MVVMLPSLALALLCLLQAGADVSVQPDFNAKKFAGSWHLVAAVSNCSVFLKMKNEMKSAIISISLLPEGDLAVKFLWPLMDKCQKFELLFQRSGQAGHYLGMSAEENKELRVLDTDYSHYAILHEAQRSGQRPKTMLQLFTREQDPSPQLLQTFRELIPTVGLTEDMLAVLPASDQCTEATS